MKRETRDKFASGTNQATLTSGNACWETPPAIFNALNADYGPFDIDLCADAGRALRPAWFGPGSPIGADALTADWLAHGRRGFANPPYGAFVPLLLAKARREAALGFRSVLLLPMRATKAFHAHVLGHAAELLFCDRRIVFFEDGVPRLNTTQWIKNGRNVPDSALFDSIIVTFDPSRLRLNVRAWAVPKHVSPSDIDRAAQRRAARLEGVSA
jgi:hypothetical protein